MEGTMRNRALAGSAGGVAGAAVGLPAFYLARRLRYEGFDPGKDRKPPPLDLQVTAVSDQTVTLRRATRTPDLAASEPGHFLLQGARGWGYAGRVIDSNGLIAIREFHHGGGDLRAGDYLRLDSFAHPSDPREALGLAFEHVRFNSPLGSFPAWYVPGSSSTWAIMTHGKGADRREALRMIPALAESGLHCLAITYRNDLGVPASPNGLYSYGRDEWEELDGAVAFARARGASDIVLVGYSMGGAITLSFMAKSANSPAVSALILDAPMSNLAPTVEHGARRAGLPIWFLGISNRLAALRYGFNWTDFDYLKTLPNLHVPVLLFHGDADATVPVELSDAFAARRPDLVRYVRVPGTGHVRAWNTDPAGYELAVREFVRTRRSVRT
jgi:pimeloyl-ACP methyl ester carboxylesterase